MGNKKWVDNESKYFRQENILGIVTIVVLFPFRNVIILNVCNKLAESDRNQLNNVASSKR